MTSTQSRLHDWADVILADLQNISTIFFSAAERKLRTIIMQIFRLIQAFFLAKSCRFKSADFASVMTDDVGCSGRHQCTQCDCLSHSGQGLIYPIYDCWWPGEARTRAISNHGVNLHIHEHSIQIATTGLTHCSLVAQWRDVSQPSHK